MCIFRIWCTPFDKDEKNVTTLRAVFLNPNRIMTPLLSVIKIVKYIMASGGGGGGQH